MARELAYDLLNTFIKTNFNAL